jgi:hypothetical protein
MDESSREIVRSVASIIKQVRIEERKVMEISEGVEKEVLRETIYDLEQAGSLLARAVNR